MSNIGQVVWTKSLHFKLFVVFSVFLLALVTAMTLENSVRLDQVLSRQSKDNQTFSTQRAAASIHANLTSWSAAIYTTVHLANRFGIQNAGNVADSFLASNSLAISFSLFSKENTQAKEELFRFTNDRARHALLRGAASTVLAQIRKPPPQQFLEATTESPRLFVPLGDESQNLIQIWIPFKLKVKSSEKKMWAGVTFVNTTLASFLPKSGDQTAAILADDGSPILTPTDVTLRKWRESFFADVEDKFVKDFVSDLRAFRSQERVDSNGMPVITTALPIQGFGAILLAEKRYSAEEQAIKAQITRALLWSWILFLVATALVYMIARKLTERIQQVVRVSARLATGDLDAQVEEGNLDEVGVLTRSVNHLGLAIRELMKERERATIQEMELKTAHAVQEGLFPDKHSESNNGISSCYYFRSASKCAGDWWGRVKIDSGRELVIIGDALGHGVPAALLAAQAFGYFVSAPTNTTFQKTDKTLDPAQLIAGFNDVLWRSGRGAATMTVFAACFDLNTMKVLFSGAGHPPPLYLARGVEPKAKNITTRGRLAGLHETSDASNFEMPIAAGDRFLLFTDGLTEATDGTEEVLGRERVKRLFMRTAELSIEDSVKTIERELMKFAKDNPFADDVTFVMIEVGTKETIAQ